MDLFKFSDIGTETFALSGGIPIQNLDSVQWIERYQEPGEFTLEAELNSGLNEFLPLGTLISHVDTLEVMVVENHEIKEGTDNPKIVVTGRSFEILLETRVVGSQLTGPLDEYILASESTGEQAVKLIKDHIHPTYVVDPLEAIAGIDIYATTGPLSDHIDRAIERGTVHERLMELLAVDDLGITTARPTAYDATELIIHKGGIVSDKVIFSYLNGEIINAEYLWSNKKERTAALVVTTWLQLLIEDPVAYGYFRKTMTVDAKYLDEGFADTAPTGGDLTTILALMDTLGRQALAEQKEIALVKVEIPKNLSKYQYRRDYSVGDIVTVEGNYDTKSLARVVEYVENENESGESGYPTLSIIFIADVGSPPVDPGAP